jgi:hypothetical protein
MRKLEFSWKENDHRLSLFELSRTFRHI